ncbi:hypothetical protein GALMADRAFT_145364 [Galerina marginata CBS 339.88]|uniref:Uncharacterized protein n=1 Tax=Galerina marginata (strain CBS 339.88) TaxID=685588 RepID=A0A067SFB5_GALM3|nr:hypothetical protein GALMADRAFT_145364 [Galerina marginata CBS 339.88]
MSQQQELPYSYPPRPEGLDVYKYANNQWTGVGAATWVKVGIWCVASIGSAAILVFVVSGAYNWWKVQDQNGQEYDVEEKNLKPAATQSAPAPGPANPKHPSRTRR